MKRSIEFFSYILLSLTLQMTDSMTTEKKVDDWTPNASTKLVKNPSVPVKNGKCGGEVF